MRDEALPRENERRGGDAAASVRLTVSYRQCWWSRRLYSMSGYDPAEAVEHAAWIAANGWNRVRIEVAR